MVTICDFMERFNKEPKFDPKKFFIRKKLIKYYLCRLDDDGVTVVCSSNNRNLIRKIHFEISTGIIKDRIELDRVLINRGLKWK